MIKDEKIKAILEAIDQGKVSANQINPESRGGTISKIKKGKQVQDITVDKIYARLLLDLGNGLPQGGEKAKPPKVPVEPVKHVKPIEPPKVPVEPVKHVKPIEPPKVPVESVANLQTTIKDLQNQIYNLTQVISKFIDASKTNEIKEIKPKPKGINVLGFSLCQDAGGRYLGVRKIDGKMVSVYIGKDINLAEQKISRWLEKRKVVAPDQNQNQQNFWEKLTP